MSDKSQELAEGRTNYAEDRTDWAEGRTAMANERTFAGWMRTAFAAIGIGIGLAEPDGPLINTKFSVNCGSVSV